MFKIMPNFVALLGGAIIVFLVTVRHMISMSVYVCLVFLVWFNVRRTDEVPTRCEAIVKGLRDKAVICDPDDIGCRDVVACDSCHHLYDRGANRRQRVEIVSLGLGEWLDCCGGAHAHEVRVLEIPEV